MICQLFHPFVASPIFSPIYLKCYLYHTLNSFTKLSISVLHSVLLVPLPASIPYCFKYIDFIICFNTRYNESLSITVFSRFLISACLFSYMHLRMNLYPYPTTTQPFWKSIRSFEVPEIIWKVYIRTFVQREDIKLSSDVQRDHDSKESPWSTSLCDGMP